MRVENMASQQESEIKTSRLILGLTLIGIGVAYILDRLGYLDAADLWSYWPLVLVAAGIGKMVTPGSGSGRLTGALITAVGTLLLLENIGLISFSFWEWWPAVLIVVGLRLIFGPSPKTRMDSYDNVNGFAALGGTSRSNCSSNFRGGDLVAFMGGAEIDLRSAAITTNPAVIDAFAFWGGIEIKVPEDWHVRVNGIPVLGGFENSTEYRPDPEQPDAMRQELLVKGFAIMGGVEIRN